MSESLPNKIKNISRSWNECMVFTIIEDIYTDTVNHIIWQDGYGRKDKRPHAYLLVKISYWEPKYGTLCQVLLKKKNNRKLGSRSLGSSWKSILNVCNAIPILSDKDLAGPPRKVLIEPKGKTLEQNKKWDTRVVRTPLHIAQITGDLPPSSREVFAYLKTQHVHSV